MKKSIIALLLTLTCITTITAGCTKTEPTTKKTETKTELTEKEKKEQTAKKEQTTNDKNDSKTEIKTETYYAIQDGVSTYVQANMNEPTPRVFNVNDELKIVGEEVNGFRQIFFASDTAMEYVESKFIAKEKVSTSASATPTAPTTQAPGVTPTTPTTPSKPATTTKPSTTTTTKPNTPAPAPVPVPAPAPASTYTPIPVGWNNYKSVCKADTSITPEQKAQIDAFVETWIKTSGDNAALRMRIIQYLHDNGNFTFHDVTVGYLPSIILTDIESRVRTTTINHYDFRATYSTGVKNECDNATLCKEYMIFID